MLLSNNFGQENIQAYKITLDFIVYSNWKYSVRHYM